MDPPKTIAELLERARTIDGMTIGALARQLGVQLSEDPVRTKGHAGELIERALGAHAQNQDLPDFIDLGVELKTIPMDRMGRVRESTFVSAIDLDTIQTEAWDTSRVWRKLRHVLWVPIEAASTAPLSQRHIGTARLWQPNAQEEAILRADWLMLMGRIAVGGIDEVTAHMGEALQIRPKAANSSVSTTVRGPHEQRLVTVPRGFYLRARFTQHVMWRISSAT